MATIHKTFILILSLLLCLSFLVKQIEHIHNIYMDEPVVTFAVQLEADNEFDVSEPVILAHYRVSHSLPVEISYQEQSAHYMQPDAPPFLKPPKA